jgi:hypothetical protein
LIRENTPLDRPSGVFSFREYMSKTTEGYYCWWSMKQRCKNPNAASYKYYGAEGKFVCQGLSKSFQYFISTIGQRPGMEYSVDRINNDGNYTCGTCLECTDKRYLSNIQWATAKEQANNRRKMRPRTRRSTHSRKPDSGISLTPAGNYKVRLQINGNYLVIGTFKTIDIAREMRYKTLAEYNLM